ncbi:UDP-N-acetylmuramate: L-alanyl-gamma-D-glutamyl-meso-diaminopimelate ligase [Hymenobacter daecheongensis DSM 21074]|uniref:UDP-N-acetylmuramate: L-alanyl-gamma-D-glutamyl-meso-diaminopimelate ligase n=1 Tax=Hymenobacter daecheongensis DSM 21074 TaxID=1121955 RepID=A0A1M6I224_9BACT|nr:Mur ligase family protein [Hymenobacter daecheongensis]SHJ28440.1 UDP-N-acetylmuramate: L-alanyl-gamma-D-glutamyl-meso-diaminopimelate ligase [Hymenobacter daecheongensis DSM 21074]
MAATPASLNRLHLIATGGSIMHNLALALHRRGAQVTGSDDEIFEPAKSRLAAAGLLPAQEGWFPEKITADLDAVIVGMHARADNPELLKAQELGLRIYSFPEFIYEASKDKQRVVIGGSHGKTSITSLILHVLRYHGRKFDYAVGAQLEGFDLMVQLTEDSPIIIIEGDEYLSSPIDRRPKFHLYQHHIGLISGISWDHINVFPTEEDYREQFRIFAEMTPKAGVLIYDQHDEQVQLVTVPTNPDVKYIGYGPHEHTVKNGKTTLITKKDEEVPIQVFGDHNLRNISAAKEVCKQLGIKGKDFYEALATFKGAARRLELVREGEGSVVYKDFAHAPSKLKATATAFKKQYPKRRLVACLELHTFSSLNPAFLPQYAHTFDAPDVAIVYFNPQVLAHKRLPPLPPEAVQAAFQRPDLKVFTDSKALAAFLHEQNWQETNLLMMSSGTFDGLDLNQLAEEITR